MATSKNITRSVKIYLDGKEVVKNVSSIQAELRKAREDLRSAQIGSDEYRRAMERVATLDGILKEHREQLKKVKEEGESLAKSAKGWFSEGFFNAVGYKALDLLKDKLADFKRLFSERQSSAANLKALTGLDDESIAWLTEQAKQLSTTMDETGLRVTQSSKEILDAYMLVGSAKPELLGDKEALNAVTVEAMRLSQAAKMELSDAVNGVTLALNQYGASADEAARYVNVLAAGSKSGSAGVEDQTAAIIKAGVAASTAGVNIEELVGSIETLAEKGIKAEVAGTGLKNFFLTLEAGPEDCRPSVVGLQQALENLNAKGYTSEQMMEKFGKGTYTVAQAMISSADSFKQYTAAVTDTNVAVEQAAINSDTAETKAQQLKNQINELGMSLYEQLAPAFSFVAQSLATLLQLLPPVIGFIGKHIGLIGTLSATLYLYSVRQKIAATLETAWNAVTAAGTAIKKAWNTQLGLSTISTGRYAVAMKSASAGTALLNQATLLLKGVFSFLTGQIKTCTAAFKALGVALKANPIGLVITGVTLLYQGVKALIGEEEEATEATEELTRAQETLADVQKNAASTTADEKIRIEQLTSIIHDNAASYDEKRQAIAQLQKIIPGYNATLSREGKILSENSAAIDQYLTQLDKMALAKAAYDKVVEMNKKLLENTVGLNAMTTSLKKYAENKPKGPRYETVLAGVSSAGVGFYSERETDEWKEYNAGLKPLTDKAAELVKTTREDIQTKKALMEVVGGFDTETTGYFNRFKLTNGETAVAAPEIYSPSTSGGSGSGTSNKGKGGSGGRSGSGSSSKSNTGNRNKPDNKPDPQKEEAERQRKEEERIRKELEAIELEYQRRMNELKAQFYNGEITSEQDYNAKAEDLTIQRLNAQLEVQGLSEEKQTEITSKVYDIWVRHRDELLELSNRMADDMDGSLEGQLAKIDAAEKEALAIIERNHQLGIIEEEEYQKMLQQIRDHYAKERKEAEDNSEEYKKLHEQLANSYHAPELSKNQSGSGFGALGRFNELSNAIKEQQALLDSLDPESDEYQKVLENIDSLKNDLKDAGGEIQALVGDIGTAIGTGLGNAIMGNMGSVKDAFKSLLSLVLDSIEKLIEATMIVPMAESIVPGVGWAKAAATLAKIAAIKIAFAALKAGIQNLWTGGYTGAGRWNDPRGIVHAGEFVANRYAVGNPSVRPVLDLIDQAQRSGNIRSLTADDIAAVATPLSARSARNARQRNAAAQTASDTGTLQMLQACTDALMAVKQRFDQPIIAETYATGKNGVNEAQDLVRKMEANSKRRL